jgi:hypothetical protein
LTRIVNASGAEKMGKHARRPSAAGAFDGLISICFSVACNQIKIHPHKLPIQRLKRTCGAAPPRLGGQEKRPGSLRAFSIAAEAGDDHSAAGRTSGCGAFAAFVSCAFC